jgi:hypothetical protein
VTKSLLNQRYIPVRKLGAGAMGEVYLANQTGEAGFRREVALKRIHRRFSEHHGAVYMFLKEARVAAALTHPNIVQIFDVGQEEDGSFFIVMENVRGTDLRNLAEIATRRGHMIPMDVSLGLVGQLLEGLRYAHTYRDSEGRHQGVVHGDIGPNNLLISTDGVVKLVDFGLASAEGRMRQEGALHAGKFAYMSPEVVNGQHKDARSDLFSTGILLYELTVGQRLFRVNSYESLRRVLADPILPPRHIRPGYPEELERIVMRALEIRPELRYGSASAMWEDLEDFAFSFGLRLSRLRLGRYVRQMLGIVDPYDALEGAASPGGKVQVGEDLAAEAFGGGGDPDPTPVEDMGGKDLMQILESEGHITRPEPDAASPRPRQESVDMWGESLQARPRQESVDLWGESLEDVTDPDADGTDPTITLEDGELNQLSPDKEPDGGLDELVTGQIPVPEESTAKTPSPESLIAEGADDEEDDEDDEEIFPDDLLNDYLAAVGEEEEEKEAQRDSEDDDDEDDEDEDLEEVEEVWDADEVSAIVVTDDLVEEEDEDEDADDDEEEILEESVQDFAADEPSVDVRQAMDELGIRTRSGWSGGAEEETPAHTPTPDGEDQHEDEQAEDEQEHMPTLDDLKVTWDDDDVPKPLAPEDAGEGTPKEETVAAALTPALTTLLRPRAQEPAPHDRSSRPARASQRRNAGRNKAPRGHRRKVPTGGKKRGRKTRRRR